MLYACDQFISEKKFMNFRFRDKLNYILKIKGVLLV